MNTSDHIQEAVEVLQQLGLKEYEARCFVGLSRLDTGTAKRLSELTEVPRTRVYDAIRVLEAQGLVSVQHSSPQRFRAVSFADATETLRDQYEDRIERLSKALDTIDGVDETEDSPVQEVWSMAGTNAIGNRTDNLIEEATDEVVFVIGQESLLTDHLITSLNTLDPDIDLLIGAPTESLQEQIQDTVDNAKTFISGLGWLAAGGEDTAIGRLLLVDRSTILVSTVVPNSGEEQAIFGEGFGNGLVVIARRLMAQGLLTQRDPAV